MSSREISSLTGKRHDNVMRDIVYMLEKLDEDPLKFEGIYFDGYKRKQVEYFLDRELTETLLTGYSPKMRRAVVRRWRELEEGQAQAQAVALPDFSNPAAAARAWAEQFELQQAASQALAIAAPKAAFVDSYVEGTGLQGFRQVSKLLKAKESEFRMFLQNQKIMYRLGGEWTAYAVHIDAGRFAVKTGQAENGHDFNAAKFTPKGIAWVAELWAKRQEVAA